LLGNLLKKSIIFVILTLLLIINPSNIYAQEDVDYGSKVYMVIVNRMSLYDIEYMDNLKTLIEDGSIGLMNTRGVTGYKGAEGYITINASSKAYSSYEAANSFNLDKEVQSIFERRTGNSSEGYSIANIEINRLNKLNDNRTNNSVIGALGDNLHNSGHKTAVFGNSDTADSFIRTNCLIAIDSNGLIDFGNVDDILVKRDDYPFGIKTDYSKMLTEIAHIKPYASLFVIETGDLDRLSQYSTNLTESQFLQQRKKILDDIDEFIGNLVTEIGDENAMLIIVSPNSPESRLDTSKLSPLIIWNGGTFKGVLTSGTTRRIGIVANIDIAPTITNYLNASSDYFVGHTITASSVNNKLGYIKELNTRVNIVSSMRVPYLNIYSFLVMLIIIIGTSAIFIRDERFHNNVKLIKASILLILALPLVFLLVAYFKILSTTIFFIAVFFLTAGILFILRFLNYDNRAIFLLTMTYLTLIIDLLLGGKLLRFSILSYDPIIGARYFGIGNEYVGVILPVMVLLTMFYMKKTGGRRTFLLILPITTLCVSHPNLGANVGGTISVLFASIYYLLYTFKIKIDLKKIIFIGIIILLFVVIMGILDIYLNTNPTHLGRTFLMLVESGPMSIMSVVLRKIQMNIKLIKNSIWSKVLFVTILSEICILLKCKKQIYEMLRRNKYFSAGIVSSIVGSIIGLLVNDSGVLLAAIANAYLVSILIYYLFEYMNEA